MSAVPTTQRRTGGLLLRHSRLADGSHADVRVSGATIVELSEAGGLAQQAGETVVQMHGRLLLPALAEPHAHLDKALTFDRVANASGDLAGAVAAWRAYRRTLDEQDIRQRGRAAALASVRRGVTALRSHVDVAEGIELRGVRALVALREELCGVVDLQVCAMAYPVGGEDGKENLRMLKEALTLGADLIGGAPHLAADPRGEIAIYLALAREHKRGVDLHMDEHLRASIDLRELTRLATGFPYPVTASHCVSLGMATAQTQDEVAGGVSREGVSVVTCPQTNLYLQGREHPVATPRALTAIAALQRAGANVAAGGDNVQDPFNPLGCGDPLQTAALLVSAAHLTPEHAYDCVSAAARTAMGLQPVRVAPGSPAELMAIAAGSVREAIATCTEARTTIHRGRIVASTRIERDAASVVDPSAGPLLLRSVCSQ